MSGYDQQQLPIDQPEKKPLTWAEWAKTTTGMIVIVLIIAVIVGGGYYWYSNRDASASGKSGETSSLGLENTSPVAPATKTGGNGITITRMRGGYY